MRALIVFILLVLTAASVGFMRLLKELEPIPMTLPPPEPTTLWPVQSIDTMKYSRDLSREKSDDPFFDKIIDRQMRDIAETGANFVAIGTPYDTEFVLFLKRWVTAARRYHLQVWFRGNWSGWEGWFEYPRISREEHLQKTAEFIRQYPELFEDGDIFTACPECENGGPGDPRFNGDVVGHRAFLVTEHRVSQEAFREIGKRVTSHYPSMNGDVARLVGDEETLKSLGNVITLDHYVRTPQQLANDVLTVSRETGSFVMLGEFGVPLPDLHGELSQAAQAEWMETALAELSKNERLLGVNYWLNVGSSTELWNEEGVSRAGVGVLRRYYRPRIISGFVADELGRPLRGARLEGVGKRVMTDKNGYFSFQIPGRSSHEDQNISLRVSALFFEEILVNVRPEGRLLQVTLVKTEKDWHFRLLQKVKDWVEKDLTPQVK